MCVLWAGPYARRDKQIPAPTLGMTGTGPTRSLRRRAVEERDGTTRQRRATGAGPPLTVDPESDDARGVGCPIIPDDKMAVAVELTDFERVAGFVNPGNEVAIFSDRISPHPLDPERRQDRARRLDPHRAGPRPRRGRRHHQCHVAHDQSEDGEQATEQVARRPS